MNRPQPLKRTISTLLRRRRPAGGSILVCVLICMSIAAALLTATVHATLKSRRQVRTEGQLRQAEWVLEAAALRAVEKLDDSPAYAGEVWSLAAEVLPGYGAARVEITVAETDSPNSDHRIAVTVVIPADADLPLRRSEEFIYSNRNLPDSR